MLRYLYVFWEPLTSVYYMSLQQNIGVALRALRAQNGVSQEKLALETGIGRHYMSDIENGRLFGRSPAYLPYSVILSGVQRGRRI